MSQVQRIKPAPIRKALRVRASRERAFQVFTQMGGWWLKTHSLLHATSGQADVIIEPRAGGRWYEVGGDGTQNDWGRVLAWEPPGRLVLAWQLNSQFTYDKDFETTIEVTFREDGEFTEVWFEHRDLERFGEGAAEQVKGMDGGWGQLLDAYQAAVGG